MRKLLGIGLALGLGLMSLPALAHEFHGGFGSPGGFHGGGWHGGGEWGGYGGGHGYWRGGRWFPFAAIPVPDAGYPCWRWYYGRWIYFCE